ncbi:MAG: 3-phosphoshikimate 1-carboxyvinyltransferase [Gemmatimonadaceae bacterium]|nr:3-phosphoshikimate 1-carboxyvinyltransferase [Gemmatimonadaceae bacterium]
MTIVHGTVRVPGDKSISHRSLILAALADGQSRIRGILQSADVASTAAALRALGVAIPLLGDDIVVDGVGLRGLRRPESVIDCGNSGTTARLVAGLVAGSGHSATLVGDSSLSRRPMRRIAEPLEAMGARIDLPPGGGLPMAVHGTALRGIEWRSPVASAQVKSAVLLAALVAGVDAAVQEPERSRDHTERMLAARGIAMSVDGNTVRMAASRTLAPADIVVPGDPSSAAFFAALAAMASAGRISLPGVGTNPTRTGFFGALARMGADLEWTEQADTGGEPVATLHASASTLRGIAVGGSDIPAMIDELPLLACVAACAGGETVIRGAAELRVKESDRIAAVVSNLRAIGADAEELEDGMRIRGGTRPLHGRVVTHGDHRLAMAFAVLGAREGNDIEVDDRACVGVSYPGFWDDLKRVVSD